ncbi:tyrosine-protein phosphatase non-receptor type 18 isoform X2 [Scyliorhinus canicula]|uniref:tyrosine-protein phosphatase non-receptor type 18 isoform X2 n=1 Tax=Scyliorhinus canicula TaxID=7830 RepID=UPI0018F502A0|nr:tyrosine-protein phosphatase non-receptor type 18 isoform X2 [Scyliorhinus canicula]
MCVLAGSLSLKMAANQKALLHRVRSCLCLVSIKRHLASISEQPDLSTEAGKVRANIKKNRYKDILPFDQTRVPLTLLLNEGYSDYINANFVRGIDGERYYIATQGPLAHTVVDFWRMIWEFNVKVVVMACREFELGKKKCERYWATEEEETIVLGPFTVTNVVTESLRNEVIIRTLSVTLLDETEVRAIHQFQYVAWPDHGIPRDFNNLLEMLDLIDRRQGELTSPICVHCSAGCGRTGVICTVDYVRSLLKRKLIGEEFAILDIVRKMRRQRPAAVQTKDQYEFIYRIVAQLFQTVLANSDHNYENLRKDRRPSEVPGVRQPPLVKSPKSPKRPSGCIPPAISPRPLTTESMPKEGPVGDTYAVVARPKSGGGVVGAQRPSAPVSQVSAGCEYENLAEGGRPVRETSLYTTVIVKEVPRPSASPQTQYAHIDHSPKAKGASSSCPQATISYSAIDFGQPRQDARGSPAPATSKAADSEGLAPSLPERTADSYIVQDADESGACSNSGSDSKRSSKLLNVFKMGFPGNPVRKESANNADDGYEDVGDVTTAAASSFSAANGLGFNSRVSKPKGPRPPPELWAVYGQ